MNQSAIYDYQCSIVKISLFHTILEINGDICKKKIPAPVLKALGIL